MGADEILSWVRDNVGVRSVYGEAYERDGALVIPVARVRAAGGGGGGESAPAGASDPQNGAGGGGVYEARPVGVYVIRDGDVSWQPAVDVTRIVLTAQAAGIISILVARSIVRTWRRRA